MKFLKGVLLALLSSVSGRETGDHRWALVWGKKDGNWLGRWVLWKGVASWGEDLCQSRHVRVIGGS